MKDLTIKAETLKREGIILLILFGVAVLVNVYAIITLDGSFIELFTQLGWTVFIAVVLYVLSGIVRGIVHGIRYLVKKRSAGATGN